MSVPKKSNCCWSVSVALSLLAVIFPFASSRAEDGSSRRGESSPLIVGAWKQVCTETTCPNPLAVPDAVVDAEFINSTHLPSHWNMLF